MSGLLVEQTDVTVYRPSPGVSGNFVLVSDWYATVWRDSVGPLSYRKHCYIVNMLRIVAFPTVDKRANLLEKS